MAVGRPPTDAAGSGAPTAGDERSPSTGAGHDPDTGGVRYRFEDAELDTDRFLLRVGGERVPVEPQVFEVLAHLVTHRDRLVPRTELLDTVWGNRFVTDAALASRVATARAAIGDDGRAQRCIRTVHGRGLQFVAEVEELGSAPSVRSGSAAEDVPRQRVRFVTAPDGLRLATATVGSGVPLVKAANWLTHVEEDWRSPVWQHWLTGLGDRFEYTRYDPRGCGLSDRDLGERDLTDPDTWVADLEAVADEVGAERFVLLGMSQGCVPAVGYAVRHPDRVAHLVLYGGYSRGMALRGEESAAQSETLQQLIRGGWGGANPAFRTVFTLTFLPEATSEQMRWFDDLQLSCASVENAARLESAFHHVDLAPLAGRVTVPTTVVHVRDDRATPYDEGRRLAGLVPGAELVTLESPNHVLTGDEPAWPEFLAVMERIRDEVAADKPR
jgi:pimeloyl-ACP methyl ester carboxylesterase/DNA-binding winged helix-turn-helix (wHTH) protein